MLFLLKDNFLSKSWSVVLFLRLSSFSSVCLCEIVSPISCHQSGGSKLNTILQSSSKLRFIAARILMQLPRGWCAELPNLSAASISSSWFTCPDWGSRQWADFTQVPGRCLWGWVIQWSKSWSLDYKKTMLFPAQAESQPFYLNRFFFFFLMYLFLIYPWLLGFLLIFIFL